MTVILFTNTSKLHFRYSNQKLNSSNKLCLFRKCNKFLATKFSCWNLCAAAAAGLSPIYDNNSALGRVLKHWLANLIELLPCYSFLLFFSPFFPLFFCFFATELNAFKLKIAFLQLDEGLYVQHKKSNNNASINSSNNNNCKTHSAARLLRVSLQYFFLLLLSFCCI